MNLIERAQRYAESGADFDVHQPVAKDAYLFAKAFVDALAILQEANDASIDLDKVGKWLTDYTKEEEK